MRALARGLRRVEKIAGEFADILEQRAVPVGNVVPKTPRREFVADQHRAAAYQDGSGRNHAADAVVHRQAIVHPVAGPDIHQSGEPETPLQQPPVTDVGCFRQARRAGGIDQQRAIGDRGRAALGRRERLPREPFDRAIDALVLIAVVAMHPDLRRVFHARRCVAKLRGMFGCDNRMLRHRDIDAVRERMAAKLCVDQRDGDADAAKAEPDRHVFRPVRHHQANGIAFGEALIEPPARKAVGASRKRAVAESLAGRNKRRRVALRLRQLLDDLGQQALRIGRDRRGCLERAHPIVQRDVLFRVLRFCPLGFDQRHAASMAA